MDSDQCPICHGSGRAISQRYYNKVSGGDPVETTCWMCDGAGVVVKQETKHLLLHKYWIVGGNSGTKEVET
jgi:DnaJ-class molecular chaperone